MKGDLKMAEFISHHLFGQEILALMPKDAQNAAKTYKAAFNWGLQGPDPFFYHALALGAPFKKYGNLMHSQKTDELFYAFSRAVNRLCDERQIIAQAYFYGFLCHYALDSNIHPYVYCRQIKWKEKMPQVSDSSIHCRIENDIDHELFSEKYQKPVTDFNIDKEYKLSEQESAVIAVILQYILKSVYDVKLQTQKIRMCFEEMRQIIKLLYNKNQTLLQGLKKLEFIVGKGMISSHMKIQKPNWDCLNLNHNPWFNSWQPNIIRSESVPEIFDKAGKHVVKLAVQYSSELDAGWMLLHHFDVPFDNGNPKNRAFKQLPERLS